jgi:uncharacterized protein YbjT (DUF2867 family)
MRFLVTGGTGTVGSQVVRGLTAGGHDVRVLTRDPTKLATAPAGVTAVQGDLLSPKTVRSVFADVDGVFLLNPVSRTEASEGLMAVLGMVQARVPRVVYMSVHHADRAATLPHFGSKLAVEAAIKSSGIPFTILRPDSFDQNDLRYKVALLQHGIYPQPIGDVGTNRVDVRDIADAAVAALTSDGHAGEVYDVVGPDVVSGAECAAIWSRALGRPVAYAGNDLDAWETRSLAHMPDWMVFDLRAMYAHFQRQGLLAAPGAVERLTRVLGHPPRQYEDFVRETAAAWRA